MKKTDDIAIEIKNVSKEFVLPQSKNSSIKHAFVNIVKRNNKTVQKVLDGVSFNINKGDFFGIVGRNGSGKSTLLKILAGVYTPTSGAVKINGKLTPFIELGVGFNPELSGRDNVFLNGALLGFTHDEMASMYDEIVEFAELEPFMDQKLKNYSSGMQVRLAFSVAIKARNEIMIFDEVLAVGDEAFQRKCMDIFEEYKAQGQTIVLVTHDMATVRKFCTRAALISEGEVKRIGRPSQVADEYSRLNQVVIDLMRDKKNGTISEGNTHRLEVAMTSGEDEKKRTSFSVNQEAKIKLTWQEYDPQEIVILDIYKRSGEPISSLTCRTENQSKDGHRKGGEVTLNLNIAPGSYYLAASVVKKDFSDRYAIINPVYEFSIINDWAGADYVFNGVTGLVHRWRE